MRRRETIRADSGQRKTPKAPRAGTGGAGSGVAPHRTMRQWTRTNAVTLAIAFAVLLMVGASLHDYMSAATGGGNAAHRIAGAGPVAAATATPQPKATVTPKPQPTRAPANYKSISRNSSMGCTKGAPAPLPTVITSGVHSTAPNEVALTFDDGPGPDSTPAILSVLEQTHTPATFMVEGQYAIAWPYLLRREWNDGFAIGIHTWNHPNMTTLSPAAQVNQLASTLAAIHAALGANACIWFWRPPYEDYNAQVLRSAASLGLTTVTWNDDPQDWSRPGVSTIVSRVLGQVRPGSIVLMHDGPAQRQETAAALPIILAGLRARGLHPVTLPNLLSDGGYPGVHPLAAVIALAPAPPKPAPLSQPQPADMRAEGMFDVQRR